MRLHQQVLELDGTYRAKATAQHRKAHGLQPGAAFHDEMPKVCEAQRRFVLAALPGLDLELEGCILLQPPDEVKIRGPRGPQADAAIHRGAPAPSRRCAAAARA